MSIYEKLFAIQSEIEDPVVNAKNDHFKSQYVDLKGVLQVIRPMLKKHEVLMMVFPEDRVTDHGNQVQVLRMVFRDMESGEEVTFVRENVVAPTKNMSHATGGAQTYGLRYALTAFFAIVADKDDDGNSQSQTKEYKPAPSTDLF